MRLLFLTAGLPKQHLGPVKSISSGHGLFLFNVSSREMHGIFEAVGTGGKSLEASAFASGGTTTPYPAQVRPFSICCTNFCTQVTTVYSTSSARLFLAICGVCAGPSETTRALLPLARTRVQAVLGGHLYPRPHITTPVGQSTVDDTVRPFQTSVTIFRERVCMSI